MLRIYFFLSNSHERTKMFDTPLSEAQPATQPRPAASTSIPRNYPLGLKNYTPFRNTAKTLPLCTRECPLLFQRLSERNGLQKNAKKRNSL